MKIIIKNLLIKKKTKKNFILTSLSFNSCKFNKSKFQKKSIPLFFDKFIIKKNKEISIFLSKYYCF